jgi:hypothetical protein
MAVVWFFAPDKIHLCSMATKGCCGRHWKGAGVCVEVFRKWCAPFLTVLVLPCGTTFHRVSFILLVHDSYELICKLPSSEESLSCSSNSLLMSITKKPWPFGLCLRAIGRLRLCLVGTSHWRRYQGGSYCCIRRCFYCKWLSESQRSRSE